jgi:hypothetical protein
MRRQTLKEIVIDVSDEGEVKIETKGFSGKVCVGESAFLKELLGKETYRQLTPAYYGGKTKTKKFLTLCG